MKIFIGNKVFQQFDYLLESDFELDIVRNAKLFFGASSIYIDAKKKLDGRSLGNTIPDGFLFDFSNKSNPEFYIVEVELAKHDFFRHIFPQITRFFSFFKSYEGQSELVEKIFWIVNNDVELKKQFRSFLHEQELYKFLKDTIEESQNILLVIDGEKRELPEIQDTYTDTWGKKVKVIQVRKFSTPEESLFTMSPDFDILEYASTEDAAQEEVIEKAQIDEKYHLDDVNDFVRHTYFRIKSELLAFKPDLQFRPQTYYIGLKSKFNIGYFYPRRKKLRIVVKEKMEHVKTLVNHHPVNPLSVSVQKFYNGPCCEIIIEHPNHIEEVITVLKNLALQYSLEGKERITA